MLNKRGDSRSYFVIINNFLPKSKRSNSHSDFVILNNILPKSKRSQVTIFIILALILVVGIGLFFVLKQPPKTEVADVDNPQAYIETCAKDAMEEAIDILSAQGGDIEQQPGGIPFYGKNVTYLCYTSAYYSRCVNQRPLLIESITQQINDYVKPRVENCFKVVASNMEGRYDVDLANDMDFKTELFPEQVVISIKRDFKLTRDEEVRQFSDFKVGINNPLYNLAVVAMEITNQQANNCFFNDMGFMVFYPKYKITKIRAEDSTSLIYKIKEIPSDKEFIFAIRACALPIGFG